MYVVSFEGRFGNSGYRRWYAAFEILRMDSPCCALPMEFVKNATHFRTRENAENMIAHARFRDDFKNVRVERI